MIPMTFIEVSHRAITHHKGTKLLYYICLVYNFIDKMQCIKVVCVKPDMQCLVIAAVTFISDNPVSFICVYKTVTAVFQTFAVQLAVHSVQLADKLCKFLLQKIILQRS